MNMAQTVRTINSTPEPNEDKVRLYGNPRAVTNVGVGSKFVFVGQKRVDIWRGLVTGSIITIAKKEEIPGQQDFYYSLRSSQHTVPYWVSAHQLKTMINENELQEIPQAVHPHAFPGKRIATRNPYCVNI